MAVIYDEIAFALLDELGIDIFDELGDEPELPGLTPNNLPKNQTQWFHGTNTIQAGIDFQDNLGHLLQDNVGNLLIPDPSYSLLPPKPATVWANANTKSKTPWFFGSADIQAGVSMQDNQGDILQDNSGNVIIPNPYYSQLPSKPPTAWEEVPAS